ncbi:lipopolysaccharide biosynthesis protein [Lentibacillus salinarum]|uniref:Lipopolysaccharide biosynthesis protein n=1 Tax=Lentibacillus salinarum TaxID=446820 RepID=A0ABW4A0X9_9BACI
MKRKMRRLTKKPFVRDVAVMASGTAAAQAVIMALSPLITRLYGPEAYGLMGVFTAIVSIVGPVAALTYPIAIVLPKRETDAWALLRLSLAVTVGMAVASAVVLLLFQTSIVQLFQLQDVASFLFLIPVVMLFAGLLQTAEQWLIRTKQFAITAKMTVVQAVIIQGSKVGVGFFYPFASVLIVLSALSKGVKALLLMLFAKPAEKQHHREPRSSIKSVAKRHWDFPAYRAPEVFINASSQSLPTLLLSGFFGPASAGFYAIGKSVLSLPVQLIGKSVGDVFYPRVSEAANNGENVTGLIRKATLSLAAVGVGPFGTVIIFGPWLFSFVFGADWVTAGEYARWMALWTFFGFINRPSVMALPVLSAQAFHLRFTIIMLITRIAALAAGYYIFASDLTAIACFGVSGAILNSGLIGITLQKSRHYDHEQSDGGNDE